MAEDSDDIIKPPGPPQGDDDIAPPQPSPEQPEPPAPTPTPDDISADLKLVGFKCSCGAEYNITSEDPATSQRIEDSLVARALEHEAQQHVVMRRWQKR